MYLGTSERNIGAVFGDGEGARWKVIEDGAVFQDLDVLRVRVRDRSRKREVTNGGDTARGRGNVDGQTIKPLVGARKSHGGKDSEGGEEQHGSEGGNVKSPGDLGGRYFQRKNPAFCSPSVSIDDRRTCGEFDTRFEAHKKAISSAK